MTTVRLTGCEYQFKTALTSSLLCYEKILLHARLFLPYASLFINFLNLVFLGFLDYPENGRYRPLLHEDTESSQGIICYVDSW